ncbi:hypothetical protein FQR65_LT18451 [Abscondita terminalis]|nr:hypothetical protein FQR65_LT18451 [Abscondita terminalis]
MLDFDEEMIIDLMMMVTMYVVMTLKVAQAMMIDFDEEVMIEYSMHDPRTKKSTIKKADAKKPMNLQKAAVANFQTISSNIRINMLDTNNGEEVNKLKLEIAALKREIASLKETTSEITKFVAN